MFSVVRLLLVIIVSAALGSLVPTAAWLMMNGDPFVLLVPIAGGAFAFTLPGVMILLGLQAQPALKDASETARLAAMILIGSTVGALMLGLLANLGEAFLVGALYGAATAVFLTIVQRVSRRLAREPQRARTN